MAEFLLKYADTRGQIHQQVANAGSEKELRDRYTQQGFLIYSIKTKGALSSGLAIGFSKRKKLNIEKFLIFNQQFVTLIRAGLPILKALDLLADRLTDPKLGPYIKSVRDEVRNGTLLSDSFRMQGIFPKIYVTTVMAGEKSGSLGEVLQRVVPADGLPGRDVPIDLGPLVFRHFWAFRELPAGGPAASGDLGVPIRPQRGEVVVRGALRHTQGHACLCGGYAAGSEERV